MERAGHDIKLDLCRCICINNKSKSDQNHFINPHVEIQISKQAPESK